MLLRFQKRQKRDPIKHYFPLPNEIFSLGLKAGEIAVYAFLLYCEDRKTFQCYPSYHTIGKAIGVSVNTVRKYVKMLEDKGFITTETTTILTKDGRSRNGSLLYTIRPIQEPIDFFHQQQFQKLQEDSQKIKLLNLSNSALQ